MAGTNDPAAPGTMIVESTLGYDPERVITGIAGKGGFSTITVEVEKMNSTLGFSRRVLEILEDHDMNIEHLPTGIDTMSLVVHTEELTSQ